VARLCVGLAARKIKELAALAAEIGPETFATDPAAVACLCFEIERICAYLAVDAQKSRERRWAFMSPGRTFTSTGAHCSPPARKIEELAALAAEISPETFATDPAAVACLCFEIERICAYLDVDAQKSRESHSESDRH
jgi:hypothetical protein